jgi:hypothetical protein
MIFESQYHALFKLVMGYPHPDSVIPKRVRKRPGPADPKLHRPAQKPKLK